MTDHYSGNDPAKGLGLLLIALAVIGFVLCGVVYVALGGPIA